MEANFGTISGLFGPTLVRMNCEHGQTFHLKVGTHFLKQRFGSRFARKNLDILEPEFGSRKSLWVSLRQIQNKE